MKIRRAYFQNIIIFSLGVLLGFFWLFPAYNHPLQKAERASIEGLRLLRILSPVLVSWAVAIFFGSKRRIILADVLNFFVFIGWPFLSWIMTGMAYDRFVVINFPLIFSFLILTAFSLWRDWALWWVIIGIASTAFVLMAARVTQYGFEFSTYYFRPRMHLGFEHPLVSGAALFTVYCALIMISLEILPRLVCQIFLLIMTCVFVYFMIQIDSRNMQIFSLVFFAVSTMSVFKNKLLWWQRFFGFVFLGLLICLLYIAIWQKWSLSIANLNHDSSVGRIYSMLSTIESMTIDYQAIWGTKSDFYNSFAVTDSVFTSFWSHFGLIGLIAMILQLWVMSYQIAKRRPASVLDAASFGGILSIMLFFLLDAQGVTPANLAVFLVFAIAYRRAVKASVDGRAKN